MPAYEHVKNNRDVKLPVITQGPATGAIPPTHTKRDESLRGRVAQSVPSPSRTYDPSPLNGKLRDKAIRSFETSTRSSETTRSQELDRWIGNRIHASNDLRPTRFPYAPHDPMTGPSKASQATTQQLVHQVEVDTHFRTPRDSENLITNRPQTWNPPKGWDEGVQDRAKIQADLRPNYLLRRKEVLSKDCKPKRQTDRLIHDTSLAQNQSDRVHRESYLRKPEHTQGMDIREDHKPFRVRSAPSASEYDRTLTERVETDSAFRALKSRDSRLAYRTGLTDGTVASLGHVQSPTLIQPQAERARVENAFRPAKMDRGAPSGIPARHVGEHADIVQDKVQHENVLRPSYVPFQKQHNAPLDRFEIRKPMEFAEGFNDLNEDETVVARANNRNDLVWTYTDKPNRQIVEHIDERWESFPSDGTPLANVGEQDLPQFNTRSRYQTMEKKYPTGDIMDLEPVDPSRDTRGIVQTKPGRVISEQVASRTDLFPSGNVPLADHSYGQAPCYQGPKTRDIMERTWYQADPFPEEGIPRARYEGTNAERPMGTRPASQTSRETFVDRTEPFPDAHVPLPSYADHVRPISAVEFQPVRAGRFHG